MYTSVGDRKDGQKKTSSRPHHGRGRVPCSSGRAHTLGLGRPNPNTWEGDPWVASGNCQLDLAAIERGRGGQGVAFAVELVGIIGTSFPPRQLWQYLNPKMHDPVPPHQDAIWAKYIQAKSTIYRHQLMNNEINNNPACPPPQQQLDNCLVCR